MKRFFRRLIILQGVFGLCYLFGNESCQEKNMSHSSSFVNYILIGPCGAGKNTVMEFFKNAGYISISATDQLRAFMKGNSPEATLIRHCSATADPIPDDLVFSILKPTMEEHLARGFIMESFPYNLIQWSFLKDWLSSLHLCQKVVFIYLKTDPEIILQRLKGRLTCSGCSRVYHVTYKPPRKTGFCDYCNGALVTRACDTPETIQKRIKRFENETLPVLSAIQEEHFPLLIIDGNQFWTPEKLNKELKLQGIQQVLLDLNHDTFKK